MYGADQTDRKNPPFSETADNKHILFSSFGLKGVQDLFGGNLSWLPGKAIAQKCSNPTERNQPFTGFKS
jgi:hypothetical protein